MKQFLDHIGTGLMFVLICLGIGGCAIMLSHADKLEAEATAIRKGVETKP